MKTTIKTPDSPYYEDLLGEVDEEILHLQDARGVFLLDKVPEKPINYFLNQCLNKPWKNHILLEIFIDADRNMDTQSIITVLKIVDKRIRDIFHVYNLKDISGFNIEVHMYEYLKGVVLQEHSNNMRTEFLIRYSSIVYTTRRWVASKLGKDQQEYFQQYLFPIPPFSSKDFPFSKLAMEERKSIRKGETDAIVPLLPKIRAEGHFRWSQIKRIRDAFLKACKQVKDTREILPLEFHYDEPERIGERFYFRLWDKPSFVLCHKEHFSNPSIRSAETHTGVYSDKNNHYFVEFIRAERMNDDDIAEGLWFTEIFEEGFLGNWNRNATDKEVEQKRQVLQLWGYGEENSTKNPVPFSSQHKGILTSSTFVSLHKDKAEGILFDVEPLYAATTFGLLAVDIFTTTGSRLNELLQLSNTKECIRTIRVNNQTRFSFYAVPKGRDIQEPFYISDQTMKLIQIVSNMLREHYNSKKIPSVDYRHNRQHLFPEPKPYFFQYHYKALKENAINSCIRFLLHGLRFETQEGNPVIIKTHLLRHAFATEAVQRQKMPIDIVAKLLHQRDINVTGYYSEPTSSQIAQSVSDLHDIIADYVDLDEAILRSPEELQKQLEDYKEKVGVFNNVLGGTCVEDAVCPIKMQCLGCRAKIPQPEKKNELHEVIELSKDMEKRYGSLGLDIEVKKARTMRKYARNELKEIELIEQYQEEQKYEPNIRFDK
ncbi:site-specific integrase [Bacillus pacificus]|uniref:site-specific integrase n=1 Tax=Bacillus pacificus TaxID=2026187 RepID=UPI001D0E89DF|nr:site-specific integrase [Bacillus pacificus]MCC2350585.1 site-specific integrase [Bacillus pacificus]MCC2469148.1 site-specific integrase [Bacillus pacificus]MCU5243994.1 site-specific integrase [Bacillus pacificus]MCU5416555.1 site-specific integrase [Bacillus pacificus]MCU5464834.1 site-specific integrase [Bacillus pacificus]